MFDRARSAPARAPRRLTLALLAVAAPALLSAGTALAQDRPCPSPPNEPASCAPPPSATVVPFAGDTGPLRARKSAFDLTQDEVDQLKRAFAALRQLARDNPNDPRGWLLQANVHCWHCGGGRDGLRGEQVHSGYWFLPWHRAYLYFMEKILGQLVGDPAFALPYWDWENPGRNRLPPAYVTPNDASNPLFDRNRRPSPRSRIRLPSVSGAGFRRIMAASSWRTFMGDIPSGLRGTSGVLETGAHGDVHVWTGLPGPGTCGGPDMGVFSTAAQDPLFFAHHGNIDRLWDVWLASDPVAHTNPTAPEWASHRWTFYDENGRWVSISVQDLVQHERSLRYAYAPPALAEPTMAFAAVSEAEVGFATALGVATRLTPTPQTVRVPLTTADRLLAVSAFSSAQALEAAALPAAPTLEIEGITMPPGAAASVRVFVNLPGATARTSTGDPHYVGSFTLVPHSSAHPVHTSISLELSPDNQELLMGRNDVQVTLVPVTIDNATPREISLTYERVYLSPR